MACMDEGWVVAALPKRGRVPRSRDGTVVVASRTVDGEDRASIVKPGVHAAELKGAVVHQVVVEPFEVELDLGSFATATPGHNVEVWLRGRVRVRDPKAFVERWAGTLCRPGQSLRPANVAKWMVDRLYRPVELELRQRTIDQLWERQPLGADWWVSQAGKRLTEYGVSLELVVEQHWSSKSYEAVVQARNQESMNALERSRNEQELKRLAEEERYRRRVAEIQADATKGVEERQRAQEKAQAEHEREMKEIDLAKARIDKEIKDLRSGAKDSGGGHSPGGTESPTSNDSERLRGFGWGRWLVFGVALLGVVVFGVAWHVVSMDALARAEVSLAGGDSRAALNSLSSVVVAPWLRPLRDRLARGVNTVVEEEQRQPQDSRDDEDAPSDTAETDPPTDPSEPVSVVDVLDPVIDAVDPVVDVVDPAVDVSDPAVGVADTASDPQPPTRTEPVAVALSLVAQPVAGSSGVPFVVPPRVMVVDGSGQAVGDAAVEVRASVERGSGVTLGGVTAVRARDGVADFADLTLVGRAHEEVVLRFAAEGLGSVSTDPMVVAVGPGVQLAVVTEPSAENPSGERFRVPPWVVVADAEGNTVVADNETVVRVEIASGAGGRLGGTTSVRVREGVARFDDLSLAASVSDSYTLRFTASGLEAATSRPVRVTAGTGVRLALLNQPAAGASGSALPQQPLVAVLDGAGNTARDDEETVVRVEILSGSAGSLSGSTAVRVRRGTAVFTDLALSGASGETYVLRFAAAGLEAVDSQPMRLAQ